MVKHIDGIVHGGGAVLDVVEEPGLVVSVGCGGDDDGDAGGGVDGGGVDGGGDNAGGDNGGGRGYGGYLVVRVGRHQVGRGVQQLLHYSLYLVK